MRGLKLTPLESPHRNGAGVGGVELPSKPKSLRKALPPIKSPKIHPAGTADPVKNIDSEDGGEPPQENFDSPPVKSWRRFLFLVVAFIGGASGGAAYMIHSMHGNSTSAPTLRPSLRPTTPSPSLAPTTEDAVSVSSLTSSSSTSAPTLQPSLRPTTPSPSLAPTTEDTVSVSVAFDVEADAEPTAAEEAMLKTTIANSAGVNEDSVEVSKISS